MAKAGRRPQHGGKDTRAQRKNLYRQRDHATRIPLATYRSLRKLRSGYLDTARQAWPRKGEERRMELRLCAAAARRNDFGSAGGGEANRNRSFKRSAGSAS